MTSIEKFEKSDSLFEKYMKVNETRLRARALKLMKNHDNAEDLYQDTSMRLFLNMHKIPDEKVFLRWGFKLMLNIYLDYQKKLSNRVHISFEELNKKYGFECEFEDKSVDIENEYILKTLDEKMKKSIKNGINCLASYPRQVISLYTYGVPNPLDAEQDAEGLSYPQIAKIINSTDSAVKATVCRAKNTLQNRYNNSTW